MNILNLLSRFESAYSNKRPMPHYTEQQWEELTNFFLQMRLYENVRVAAEIAHKQHPQQWHFLIMQAQALCEMGKFEESFKRLNEFAQEQTECENLFIYQQLMVEVCFGLNKNEEALRRLDKYVEQIMEELKSEDYHFDESDDDIDMSEIKDRNEHLFSSLIESARMLHYYGFEERSLDLLQQLTDIDDINVDKLLTIGQTMNKLGFYEPAKRIGERINAEQPYSTAGWQLLSDIYINQDNFAEALNAIEYSIAIDPYDELSRVRKITILVQTEKYEQAQTEIDEFERDFPDRKAFCISQRADIAFFTEDYKKANTLYTQAYKLEYYDAESLDRYTRSKLYIHRYKDCIALCEAWIELSPDDVRPYTYTADCYYELKDYKAALTALTTASKRDKTDVHTVLRIAYLLMDMQREQEALKYIQKAYRLDKESTEVLVAMILAAYINGDIWGMAYYFHEAEKTDPEITSRYDHLFRSLNADADELREIYTKRDKAKKLTKPNIFKNK